jgi:tRNA threonylcarbamoyladenosine biosynthesis protein TsaE
MTIELVIPDADAMEALGARLAPLLRAGDLILLDGVLGAGKTTLRTGHARGRALVRARARVRRRFRSFYPDVDSRRRRSTR